MKKTLLILMALTISQYSFAGNDKTAKKATTQNTEVGRFPANEPKYPKYVEECRKPATEKLKSIAQINNMTIDESSITVSSIDDRWYNPSKYVWFSAMVKKADGSTEVIQTLTQKSFLPPADCF
jgi:hypothetical protein